MVDWILDISTSLSKYSTAISPDICSQCRTMGRTSHLRTYFWNGPSWLVTLFVEQGMVSALCCRSGISFPSDYVIDKLFSGVQLVLYTSCASFLWKTRNERSQSRYLLAYITLLISIETLFMIVQAKTVQDIYIDNRNYPGGPWAYFLATQYLPINVMFYATLFVLTFLSDLLIVRSPIIVITFARSANVTDLVMAVLGHMECSWV